VREALAAAGRWVLDLLAFFGATGQLHAEATGYIARGVVEYRQVVLQMARIGANSVPIVVVTMLATGAVIALHLVPQAERIQGLSLLGWIQAEMMVRELGPAMASVVVAARIGSAMAAEIGTMKVTEQVDALRALAISPVAFLVVPRLLAAILMLPALALVADFAGVLGGLAYCGYAGKVAPTAFVASVQQRLPLYVIPLGLAKAAVFGVIIAIVCCHEGLACGMASEEVGRATTRAVVRSLLLIYVVDVFLSAALFEPAHL